MKKAMVLVVTLVVCIFANLYADNAKPFSVTIIYDNYVFSEGVKADWGFSCLIEGGEKTVLFDTGTAPEIFYANAEKMNVDLGKVELIAISHNHYDHTGNLFTMLENHKEMTVYLASFSDPYIKRVEEKKAKVVPVNDSLEISKDIFLTGAMGDVIKEQSLVLKTKEGLVVITGCAHPGIVNIIKKVKQDFKQDVYMVFGGFHLLEETEEGLKNIIAEFKKEGVVKVGPIHCTGDKAIHAFKEAYGNDFMNMGVGKNLKIAKVNHN